MTVGMFSLVDEMNESERDADDFAPQNLDDLAEDA